MKTPTGNNAWGFLLGAIEDRGGGMAHLAAYAEMGIDPHYGATADLPGECPLCGVPWSLVGGPAWWPCPSLAGLARWGEIDAEAERIADERLRRNPETNARGFAFARTR
jgi:hypothetical protein